MTEEEYIDATDLAKVRGIMDGLRSLMGGCYSDPAIPNEELSKVRKIVWEWNDRLESKIEEHMEPDESTVPLQTCETLKAGDKVLINGQMVTISEANAAELIENTRTARAKMDQIILNAINGDKEDGDDN